MMGAAKNLLVLRGGVATSGPALVFPKLRVAPSPSTTGAFHATIRPLCAGTRALRVSLSPCALGRVGCWMPTCRECGPRRLAMPRPRGVPALGNYSVCFRWLGGDAGNTRFRKDVTAGETNYSGKLPIVLRGPRGRRFGKTASGTDCGTGSCCGRGVVPPRYHPPVPRWYCDFGPFPGMENKRMTRSRPGLVLWEVLFFIIEWE